MNHSHRTPRQLCKTAAAAMLFAALGASAFAQDKAEIYKLMPNSALSGVIMPKGALFFCDTHVNVDPTAEQIAESTILAAEAVRGFGIAPKVALL